MTGLHHIFVQYSHRKEAQSICLLFKAGHRPELVDTYHDFGEHISDLFLKKAVEFGDLII